MAQALTTITLPLKHFGSGKVRETYDLGDHLLIVTTDRLSAFDVIMPQGIPYKGEILNRLAAFWFHNTQPLIANHLISTNPDDFPPEIQPFRSALAGRTMLVKKAQRIDFECVARGYLAGSAWKEYQADGAVCGIRLPEGLRQADLLPEPLFTPAIKSASGHDENVSYATLVNTIGSDLAEQLRSATLNLYKFAADYAIDKGIIIADTKFEFGLLHDTLIVIDEMLTPDSSRFWAAGEYSAGISPPSFDKQYVRDWLESSGWNKQAPAPDLPQHIIDGAAQRYKEAYEWLTDEPFQPAM